MLILTRRIGEVTFIGDDVELTILGIKGHQVRLGFNAPKEIDILRSEVRDRNLAKAAESKPPEEAEYENLDRNIKNRETDSM